jgi:hypothetical protein
VASRLGMEVARCSSPDWRMQRMLHDEITRLEQE